MVAPGQAEASRSRQPSGRQPRVFGRVAGQRQQARRRREDGPARPHDPPRLRQREIELAKVRQRVGQQQTVVRRAGNDVSQCDSRRDRWARTPARCRRCRPASRRCPKRSVYDVVCTSSTSPVISIAMRGQESVQVVAIDRCAALEPECRGERCGPAKVAPAWYRMAAQRHRASTVARGPAHRFAVSTIIGGPRRSESCGPPRSASTADRAGCRRRGAG